MAFALASSLITIDLQLLDAVYEAGYTHWDTGKWMIRLAVSQWPELTSGIANVYKDSEDILGKWFKRTGKRSEVFLATKFGVTPDGPRGDPTYVRESIEKSLARLGVDYVDLYYLHRSARYVLILLHEANALQGLMEMFPLRGLSVQWLNWSSKHNVLV